MRAGTDQVDFVSFDAGRRHYRGNATGNRKTARMVTQYSSGASAERGTGASPARTTSNGNQLK